MGIARIMMQLRKRKATAVGRLWTNPRMHVAITTMVISSARTLPLPTCLASTSVLIALLKQIVCIRVPFSLATFEARTKIGTAYGST